MLVKIAARVRGLMAPDLYAPNREDEQLHINGRGEQLIAEGVPPLVEVVRQGNSWQVANVTGQAALTALPTTVAGLTLWNGESGPQAKCYVIEAFGSWEAVVDATQTDVTAIFAMLGKPPVTAPTDAALAIRSFIGRSYGGRARTVAGGTVVNDGWFPHSTEGAQMAAAAAGANWKVNECRCRGLYIIPPGGSFNVQAVKAAAAAAAQQFFFIRYHEMMLSYPA